MSTGAEQVHFSGVANDDVAWLDSPWALGCNLEGLCCGADGATTCEKPLTGVFVEFTAGETAYVYVDATGPYELTITGG